MVTQRIDISDRPEVRRLLEDLGTAEAVILSQDDRDPALVTRIVRSPGERGRSQLWESLVSAQTDGPGDVSKNKGKYRADAYTANHE